MNIKHYMRYETAGACLMGAILLATGMICGVLAAEPEKEIIVQEHDPETIIEYVDKPQVITVKEIVEVDSIPQIELTDDEKELIARVVYAEAGYEDMIGKRLVVDTILNRVGRPGFADTIYGVVYQPNQYCRATMYTEECMQAVEMECMERLDSYVIWFCNSGFMPYGVPAYQHGHHYFNWIVEEENGSRKAIEQVD
jgi:hypothetical protein